MATRILIVEDEALIAAELEARLVDLGYDVVGVAGHADQALALLETAEPDLALMDIRLRGTVDGVELARLVRERYALPTLFLTAHSDAGTLARAKEVEPLGYLLKPFSDALFVATLEVALHNLRMAREREEAERMRRQAEALASAIVDGTPDGIVTVDARGRIIQINRGAERMFGVKAAEVHLAPLEILLPEEHRARHRMHTVAFRSEGPGVRRLMAERRPVMGRQSDGTTFPADISLTSIEVDGEVVTTAIVRDLTARREMEDALLRSQKLEVVGRLATSVAHDVNNLLTVVLGAAHVLPDALDEPEVILDLAEQLSEAGVRGSALTRQLLAFTRTRKVGVAPISPERALSSASRLLAAVAGDRCPLRIDADPKARIRMDAIHLDQVLLNLVVNAREALPDGGTVEIRVRTTGPRVRITVEDHGVGMDEDTIRRCLEPFFTTKGEGSGLGLATVQTIARMYGGEVTIESEPGVGTVVVVDLPSCADALPTADAPVAPKPAATAEVVLLTEDDPSVRRITERILRQQGFQVLLATGPGEALSIVQSGEHHIDVLLTDYHMPMMNGVELAAVFRRRYPEARVVLMTGDATVHVEPPMVRIRKPFNTAALLAAVARSDAA